MGELLSKDMLFDLLINIINIVVLFLVTRKLLYKPVVKYLTARREKTDALFTDAEKAKSAALETEADYKSKIALIEAEKETIKEKAISEAETEKEKILLSAKERADTIISEADKAADTIMRKAVKNSREEISDAAVAIAEKILRRECSDSDNKAIIESYFNGETNE